MKGKHRHRIVCLNTNRENREANLYMYKVVFLFMRIIYPTDYVRTVFVRVTNSDQIIFNVGVSFCADFCTDYLDRVKRIWYLSPMRAAKVQASLRIRAVSPELSLLAHTSSESRGTFRQKTRPLAPLNGWDAQLKFVMTECSKTQIRLTGLI